MSEEPIITCPKCGTEIKLTDSLAAPLVQATKQEYEKRLSEKDTEINAREKLLKEREATLQQQKDAIDEQVAEKLAQARTQIVQEESEKARQRLATDIEQKTKEVAELQEVLKVRDIKLAEAQNAQAELIRKQRELDDAKRELELTVEKRVQESIGVVRDQARKQTEEQFKYKVMEREETIAAMQKQIEELNRRAEQGSQQLQGEVQELELENILRSRFPHDLIEPVPKGEHGGDVLQRVMNAMGQVVISQKGQGRLTRVNISDLLKGIYFIAFSRLPLPLPLKGYAPSDAPTEKVSPVRVFLFPLHREVKAAAIWY